VYLLYSIVTFVVFVGSPPKEAVIVILCGYATGALACLYSGSLTDANDGGDRLQAVTGRHADVEQEQIGLQLPHELDDVLGAFDVGDHVDVVLHLKNRAQPIAEERVIVD
jgi:hypothetical protein